MASNYTTRYGYSGAGELSQITYPSGLKIYYRRNASGQITGIDSQQPGADKLIVPFVSELAYTALGQPRSWRWASGDTAASAFDADGRMAGNEFASYRFDAASRITAITQSLWTSADGGAQYKAAFTWLVGYDRRGRITGFTRPGQEASYRYDANGNRLSAAVKTDSGAGLDGDSGPSDTAKTSAQALNIDSASNRLLGFVQTQSLAKGSQSLATTTSPVNFSLDAGGNLTHDGASGFDYDSANRPAQGRIRQGGEAFKIAYLHNALGQRVFKSEAQAIEGLPNEAELGAPFIAWLKARFGWLFAPAQTNALLGQSYADGALPRYALLGEKWLRLFEQPSPIYKWTPGGSQRCRVVQGGGRRLRRTDRSGTKNLNSAISASFQ